MLRLILFIVISLTVLAGGVKAQLPLRYSDMQNLIPGKMAVARDAEDDKRFTLYFGLDRTVTQIDDTRMRQTGKWRLRPNGHLCIQWEVNPESQCFFLIAMGGGTYQLYTTGNQLIAIISRISPGRAPKQEPKQ